MSGRAQKVQDPRYAAQVQDRLLELLGRQGAVLAEDEDGPVEVNVAETYAEAMLALSDAGTGFIPGNAGVVLYMSDGTEVRLTITAYVPQED